MPEPSTLFRGLRQKAERHLVYPLNRDECIALCDAVERAAFVVEHLMQMIDPQTWRDSGGDDGQGHYEGDYREEQTFAEIQSWKAMIAP